MNLAQSIPAEWLTASGSTHDKIVPLLHKVSPCWADGHVEPRTHTNSPSIA